MTLPQNKPEPTAPDPSKKESWANTHKPGEAAGPWGDAGDIKQKAEEQVKDAAAAAGDQLGSYFHRSKNRIAEQVDAVAEAFRATSRNLQDADQGFLAAAPERVGEEIGRASEYLRNTEPRELFRQLGAVARRKPALFAGCAFITGLVLVRFLKSTEEREDDNYDFAG